ncbi:DEAD2 domain-containing protein, partial [Helicosporidium sp. ATCC 50920]
MSKCIQALESGQNALLEAPTGSGKTLSLLCSTLAWQARERHRIENSGQPLCPRPNGSSSPKSAVKKEEIDEETAQAGPRKAEKIGCKVEGEPSSDAPAHHPDPSASPPPPSKEACDATQSSPPLPSSQSLLGGFLPGAGDAGPAPSARVPKVYYSTRTHSQIAQVVAELGRTPYRPRTAILASKRHYCVHPRASQAVSVEEACEDLLRDGACVYFRGTQAAGQPSSQRVLDIEDLRQWARAHRACPYFLARRWEKEADLVFAPYSYLIDPVVRRAMEVEPRGAVLVFDEAHNMEDVAREAASAQLSRTQLDDCLASLSRASGASDKP